LAVPAMVFGSLAAHSTGGYLETAWLLAMTIGVVIVLAMRKGLSRMEGVAVIIAYLAFVAVRVYLALPS
jgi:Ca2+/Na+ antiporter